MHEKPGWIADGQSEEQTITEITSEHIRSITTDKITPFMLITLISKGFTGVILKPELIYEVDKIWGVQWDNVVKHVVTIEDGLMDEFIIYATGEKYLFLEVHNARLNLPDHELKTIDAFLIRIKDEKSLLSHFPYYEPDSVDNSTP